MGAKSSIARSVVAKPAAHERSAAVQGKVAEAAAERAEVNDVLSEEIDRGGRTPEVEKAISQSEDVEVKVDGAARDLVAVTESLKVESGERAALEQKLEVSEAALVKSKKREKKTRVDAMHDPLTRLPNLTLFNDRLRQGLAQAQRHGWTLAVLFIDLDQFKPINDSHGHSVGDAVLKLVAQRLGAGVRASDTVCRRSGDEFLVLLPEISSAEAALTLAATLRAAIAEPAVIGGQALTVGVSVGISLFPEHGAAVQELIDRADAAMYLAKRSDAGVAVYQSAAKA